MKKKDNIFAVMLALAMVMVIAPAIANVISDQYITVEGDPINTYTVSIQPGPGCIVNALDSTTVEHGDSFSFTLSAKTGYDISQAIVVGGITMMVGVVTVVTVNEITPINGIYTINNITHDTSYGVMNVWPVAYVEIYSFEDLMGINANEETLNRKYILMNDIEFTEENNKLFTPIGNYENRFTGVFDGNGHRISGINLNVETADVGIESHIACGGLFGAVYGAEIRNLCVGNITITVTSLEPLGTSIGMVGLTGFSKIENCSSIGINVKSDGNLYAYVGGIAGVADSSTTIENCSGSYIAVKAEGDIYAIVGGIIGQNSYLSTTKNCYSTGDILIISKGDLFADVGGIVSQTRWAAIENCYSTGSILIKSGGDLGTDVGGIVGVAEQTTIENCYSTRSFSSLKNGIVEHLYAGGIVGFVNDSATVSNCYFIEGSVPGDEISWLNYSLTIDDGGTGDQGSGAKTMEQMAPTLEDAKGNASIYYIGNGGWEFGAGKVWTIVEGKNNGYPILNSLVHVDLEIPSFVVTLTPGTGYLIVPTMGSSTPANYGESFSFALSVSNGYKNTAPVVKANGGILTAVGGIYTISCITESISVTVTVVADSTGGSGGTGSPSSVKVNGISVDKTNMSLMVGGTGAVTATVSPSNATNKNIAWSSSNTSVATVSDNGLITGIGVGTAAITATAADGGFTASCTINIKAPLDVTIMPQTETSDGGTIATVTSDQINSALSQAKNSGNSAPVVNINVPSSASPDKVIVNIPASGLFDIANAGGGAKISSPAGTIILDNNALKEISKAGGSMIKITAEWVDSSVLNVEQAKVVGGNPVFSVTLTVDGVKVTELNGLATVTLPYSLEKGQDPSNLVVWYVDDEGNITPFQCTYDSASGTVTFMTNHFSYYAVVYLGETNNTMLYVGIAVIVLALFAIGVAFYWRSKRLGEARRE